MQSLLVVSLMTVLTVIHPAKCAIPEYVNYQPLPIRAPIWRQNARIWMPVVEMVFGHVDRDMGDMAEHFPTLEQEQDQGELAIGAMPWRGEQRPQFLVAHYYRRQQIPHRQGNTSELPNSLFDSGMSATGFEEKEDDSATG